jgi:hypothetical protein
MPHPPLSALPPLDPRQRYTIEEATRYLRLSRPSLYLQISTGSILSIKERKRRFIPGSEIVRLSSVTTTVAAAPVPRQAQPPKERNRAGKAA